MAISAKKILLASLHSVLKTLDRVPPSEKKHPIGIELAHDFNQSLVKVAQEWPELAGALPKQLKTISPLTRMGKSTASYLDLEIACEQVLTLIATADE